MKAFVDSDVLIWHLRGERKARDLLRRLRDEQRLALWTGALQRAEVVFFMRESEVSDTLLFLSFFQTAPINEMIVDTAGELYRQWHPSHGIDVNDAFLAASVLRSGGTIYTLNVKHYPMPGLHVEKAW